MYMANARILVGTKHILYSTGLCLGFVSAKTQILGFASAKTHQRKILALGALPNANPRRQVLCVAVEYRLKALLRFPYEYEQNYFIVHQYLFFNSYYNDAYPVNLSGDQYAYMCTKAI